MDSSFCTTHSNPFTQYIQTSFQKNNNYMIKSIFYMLAPPKKQHLGGDSPSLSLSPVAALQPSGRQRPVCPPRRRRVSRTKWAASVSAKALRSCAELSRARRNLGTAVPATARWPGFWGEEEVTRGGMVLGRCVRVSI